MLPLTLSSCFLICNYFLWYIGLFCLCPTNRSSTIIPGGMWNFLLNYKVFLLLRPWIPMLVLLPSLGWGCRHIGWHTCWYNPVVVHIETRFWIPYHTGWPISCLYGTYRAVPNVSTHDTLSLPMYRPNLPSIEPVCITRTKRYDTVLQTMHWDMKHDYPGFATACSKSWIRPYFGFSGKQYCKIFKFSKLIKLMS